MRAVSERDENGSHNEGHRESRLSVRVHVHVRGENPSPPTGGDPAGKRSMKRMRARSGSGGMFRAIKVERDGAPVSHGGDEAERDGLALARHRAVAAAVIEVGLQIPFEVVAVLVCAFAGGAPLVCFVWFSISFNQSQKA